MVSIHITSFYIIINTKSKYEYKTTEDLSDSFNFLVY
jgi:hypothetical protein